MTYLKKITPHIPSEDMHKTIDFMTDVLAFEIVHQSDAYCELIVGDQVIGILSSDGKPNQHSIYFRVDDIDTLWNKIKDKIESGHHQRPFDRDYKMREVHIIVPGTATLLFLGSEIKEG